MRSRHHSPPHTRLGSSAPKRTSVAVSVVEPWAATQAKRTTIRGGEREGGRGGADRGDPLRVPWPGGVTVHVGAECTVCVGSCRRGGSISVAHMQGGFVVNPRRAPRAPARCRASVLSAAGVFRADTEDVGAHGCQLVGARTARSGERIQLEISNELVTGVLRVAGRIAWATAVEPWRLGVAFEPEELARARDWFERLVASHPGVGAFRRVPDRIPLDAPVFLGPPPRRLADFSPDELALLRWVGDGRPVREILSSFGPRWASVQRSFFALLTRQHLTLLPRVAVPAADWAAVLEDTERPRSLEPEAAVPELRSPPPAAPDPRDAARGPAARQPPGATVPTSSARAWAGAASDRGLARPTRSSAWISPAPRLASAT